jgi:hypothetical protein
MAPTFKLAAAAAIEAKFDESDSMLKQYFQAKFLGDPEKKLAAFQQILLTVVAPEDKAFMLTKIACHCNKEHLKPQDNKTADALYREAAKFVGITDLNILPQQLMDIKNNDSLRVASHALVGIAGEFYKIGNATEGNKIIDTLRDTWNKRQLSFPELELKIQELTSSHQPSPR